MRTECECKVEYNGTNPWGQSYYNERGFATEAEADAFIEKLKNDDSVYQMFKIVTTGYFK